MGLLTFPYTIVPRTREDVAQLNGNLNAIRTLVNGNIDETNIANQSVTPAKLAALYLPRTWAVAGNVAAATLPGFHVMLAPGQTFVLKSLRARISSGTSVTFKLQKNGADIVGYTGLTATTTSTNALVTSDVSLTDGDYVTLVTTAVSGTPANLGVTVATSTV